MNKTGHCFKAIATLLCLPILVDADELCKLQVIEQETGWPVPMIELRTTHNVRFVTDNAGIIAFDLPELMGEETWFSVEGHGYDVPKDGFGFRGVRLTPSPGKTLTVKVKRCLPAKRLGRITGGGIFAESQRFGLEKEWHEQGILGCDSIQASVHNGRLYWFWGDTTLARYPLGIFNTSGASTELQPLVELTPPVHLAYRYFKDKAGTARGVARMPGEGPTWISGVINLNDATGMERLVCSYVKIEPPLTEYESGLCVWNDDKQQFERYRVLWERSSGSPKPFLCPEGHPVYYTDTTGKQWLLFGDPFPRLRCAATFEAWSNPELWEPLEPQKTVSARDSNREVVPHRGGIAWNAYRKKWVTVFTEHKGDSSFLGEIWYAEADVPTGPWKNAVKVVTHNNYTFYNPCLHPELTQQDSPILLFEATYTTTFANKPEATPRYDYNQILYRLDLDDPSLVK